MPQGFLTPILGWRKVADLLVNQTTTTNGAWVDLEGYRPALVTLGGTFNATTSMRILVCNENARPIDSDVTKAPYGDPITDVTGAQAIIINEPVRFIKVQVTAIGANSVINAAVMAG